ncbi:MAG TPA: acyl-CoA dehydrogenase family protein [Planctomycetota bacterium]|jgi:butyryl-CoA dehydrogenase|nr:acyl-CoA dehydrogenase family protein [Planctomycetota bacterium]
MDFDLPQDVAELRDAAREFAERELAPRAARTDEEESFVEEQWKALAEGGWSGMSIPEAYGGGGLSAIATSTVLIEFARACAASAVTLSVHLGLAAQALIRYGNDEQRRRLLPRLASGEWIGAYALSEAGSGSDAAALRCAATPDGKGGYVLDGTKLWITSGDHAGLIVVFARTTPDARAKGITALLVETSSPGFHAGKKERKMGIRGSSTVELRFSGCRVPRENVLGEVDDGFAVAMGLLDSGRIGIASQAIGISSACLDASIKYAKERTQFGRPIAEFQEIRSKIAEMALRIESSRLLTLRAAWLKDEGRPHTMEASMAKLEASRTADFCAKEAVQIHGGAGYTKEFPVERWFRDARVTEIYEGTTEIQSLVISREVLRAAP